MGKPILRHRALCETFYTRIPMRLARRFGVHHTSLVLTLNLLIFGAAPYAATIYGLTTTFDFQKMGPTLTVGLFLAATWIFLGPLLICIWEMQYYQFTRKILTRPRHSSVFDKTFRARIRFHRRRSFYFGLFMSLFTLLLFFYFKNYLIPYTTFMNIPCLYFVTVVVLAYSGFSCGFGMSGVVQVFILFWHVQILRLEWKPFHEDGRGGYGFLGSFALVTAVAFSGGSVVVPAAISIARLSGDASVWLVYMAVAIYTLMIAIAFLYPMIRIYLLADKEKDRELRVVGDKLNGIYRRVLLSNEPRDYERRSLLGEFDKYRLIEARVKSSSSIPFSTGVGFGAISTIMSPVISSGFEKMLKIVAPLGF